MINKEEFTYNFLGLGKSFVNNFYELFSRYRGICKHSIGLPNKEVRDD